MPFNYLGYSHKGCVLKWTKSSKECYRNGLMCFKCDTVPDDFKDKCRMKAVVLELVRLYGKPDGKWEENENN